MKKLLLTLALLAGTSGSAVNAATDYYRLSWRENPSTSMVVGWSQFGGTNPVIHYGTTDYGTAYASYPNTVAPSRSTTAKGMTHKFVRLTGLQPDTAYYFVVRDSDSLSSRMWFRTAPAVAEDFSFIVGGDSRNNRTPRQHANQMVAKLRPLFVMFGGDYTNYNSNTEWLDWFADWQQTKSSDGRMYPIIATRGNHDDNLSIVDMFDVPSSSVYYALPIAGDYMRLYTLNTEITPGGTQGSWLNSDLTANTAVKWKIAQFHRPMFPHNAAKSENTSVYSAWAQSFYTHGMTLVVDSDSHSVKTTWPVRPTGSTSPSSAFIRDDAAGTVYVGEGCWGAPLRPADDVKPYTRDSGSFNMLQWVHARSTHLELRTILVGNVANVGSVSDSAPFSLPANLDVWSPANGSVITMYPRSISVNPGIVVEATNPPAAKSDDIHEMVSDSSASGGSWAVLKSDAVGDFATYNLGTLTGGQAYTVSVRVKKYNNRATVRIYAQSSTGGTKYSTGDTAGYDLYSSSAGFADLPTFTYTPGQTGTRYFRFEVIGKNSSSSAHTISVDKITLTPQ